MSELLCRWLEQCIYRDKLGLSLKKILDENALQMGQQGPHGLILDKKRLKQNNKI